MAEINRIPAKLLEGKKKPGTYADGANLYLRISDTGAASWVFRYQDNKVVKQLGLGKAGKGGRSLKDARDLRDTLNSAKENGANAEALKEIIKPKPDTSPMTFKVYAEQLIGEKKVDPRYRSKKALGQWTSTLTEYAYPSLGEKRPGAITVDDVYGVLKPLWAKIPETATRLRQRIEAVIDYAAALEDDDRRNPAAWTGRLRKLLGKAPKVVKHHAAARYQDVPTIMTALRDKDSTSAMCLRFSILTAARSGEARGALWSEVDLDDAVWAIPADRMKAKRPHRVPLCDEAVEILKAMANRRADEEPKIFAGPNGGLISDVAINKTLHGIMADITAHGFRSSFREWGAEATNFSREALELALAHVNKDKVEAAYQRSELFEARKVIMKSWGHYCAGLNNVTELKAA